jgi:hypothetical protein
LKLFSILRVITEFIMLQICSILDSNRAGIFIIWVKLFKTFEPKIEQPVFGLAVNIDTYNPIKIAFIEWHGMFKDFFTTKTSFANKFKYLTKPPGWQHDGSSILSSDLRKEWKEKQ